MPGTQNRPQARRRGGDTVIDKGVSGRYPEVARELERMQRALEQLRGEVRTLRAKVEELRGRR
jgi:hypothetical protein